MTSTSAGVAVVIVGVLLIVIGAGTLLVGGNQMKASTAWEQDAQHGERACITSYNMSYDEFMQQYRNATSDAERDRLLEEFKGGREVDCYTYVDPTKENPYRGGGSRLWTGLVVMLVGGIVLYYGTR